MSQRTQKPLLRAHQLGFSYKEKSRSRQRRGASHPAVSDVSFEINAGEIFGIAGESGSGKSTLTRLLARLLNPTHGHIEWQGKDYRSLRGADDMQARRRIQLVFQDSGTALSPRRTIEHTLTEPLDHFRIGRKNERRDRCLQALHAVGLDASAMAAWPHQLSTGQQQRICIARAVLADPDLIIADEAVSALDVSVQAQVMELIRSLRAEKGIAFLLVSHDLAVIRQLADRVGVMLSGRLVEQATAERLFHQAAHPYTRSLLAAVSEPDPEASNRLDPVTPWQLLRASRGCAFSTHCPEALALCHDMAPKLTLLHELPLHGVECHARMQSLQHGHKETRPSDESE